MTANGTAQPSPATIARLHREAFLAEAAVQAANAHAQECHARLANALGDRSAAEQHRETAREYERQAHLVEHLADDTWPDSDPEGP